MALRFGPFAFFLTEVDDAAYGTLLTRVLDTVVPGHEIISRGGVQLGTGDPGGNFERWLPPYRSHMFACQELHNALLDIRPAGSLFRLHKALIAIVKAYAYTVADYADHCAAWASADIDIDRAHRHERDGREWEALTSRFVEKLAQEWERLQSQERQRLAAMLGADEFPEQLERVLHPGFIWMPSV